MKAIIITTPGDPEVLQITERPKPEPKENEVLIRVAAAGINRPDTFQRKGRYPAPEGIVQDIPGLEVSGVIETVGNNVKNWKKGQEIIALVPGGGYAEYVCADAGSCLSVPKGILLEDAAALPEVLFTVWHNIFQRGHLKREENVLIYGGSGGIGSMAIQLVHLFGAKAHTLAGSDEKADYCKSLGAEKVIQYKKEKLTDVLENNSLDLILDSLGGDYLAINLNLLKPEGRLVYINAMEGRNPELEIMKVMVKRLHITGSTLRARSYEFKRSLRDDILESAYPLIESVGFQNMVRYRFQAKDVVKAHELMESRDFWGKMILEF